MQRVVEEGLFDRQLDDLVKEAKAPADDEGKKNVGRARVKALTPRSLKSRLRSVVVHLDKHVQEMGGASSLSTELSADEESREAVDEMVNLRNLLNRIPKQIGPVGQTAADSKGPDQ